jgi:uncharacterized membrane protein (UPF0127 family)
MSRLTMRVKIVCACLLLSFLLGMAACMREQAERVKLIMGGEEFNVEVARSREEQQRGLMFRKRLGRREGMLFVYERDQRLSFYMKNTEIPLSIAFIASNGEIMEIRDMEPRSLKTVSSRRAVRFALEVRQGTFQELSLKAGDRVEFPPGFK